MDTLQLYGAKGADDCVKNRIRRVGGQNGSHTTNVSTFYSNASRISGL